MSLYRSVSAWLERLSRNLDAAAESGRQKAAEAPSRKASRKAARLRSVARAEEARADHLARHAGPLRVGKRASATLKYGQADRLNERADRLDGGGR